MKRILFIAKKGKHYGHYHHGHSHSGLLNSARFVVDILQQSGVDAKLVQVTDNNDIDREVANFRPQIVVIEALWVVPSKFEVLKALHPDVQWVVRAHSDVPFLAQEGIAVGWIFDYIRQGVSVAFNSKRAFHDFSAIVDADFLYLPNYFGLGLPYQSGKSGDTLDVGCFGAIRPLKNQLIQAVAAIQYADDVGKPLRFHMNSRIEGGEEVLKNLVSLFENTEHELVFHDWLNHEWFRVLLSYMDVVLCDSFSETFCIVAADAVSIGTPLVCSREVPWASGFSVAETTETRSIVAAMDRVLTFPWLSNVLNTQGLKSYNRVSKKIWLDFVS